MLIRRSLDARKTALKNEIMSLARDREPDMDFQEFENYLTDGISDAFLPISRKESEWRDKQAYQEYVWQAREGLSS